MQLLTKAIKTTKIILYSATLTCVFGLVSLYFPVFRVWPNVALFSSSDRKKKTEQYHKDEDILYLKNTVP